MSENLLIKPTAKWEVLLGPRGVVLGLTDLAGLTHWFEMAQPIELADALRTAGNMAASSNPH